MYSRIKEFIVPLLHKPVVRVLTPAIAGFLAYSAWGCIANSSYPVEVWLKAGVIQGTISFFTNLLLASFMEALFRAFQNKWLTVGITIPSIMSSSFTIHTLAGTPEVLLTILPAVTIGSVYVYGYVSTLVYINRDVVVD